MSQKFDNAVQQLTTELADSRTLNDWVDSQVPELVVGYSEDQELSYYQDITRCLVATTLRAADNLSPNGSVTSLLTEYLNDSQSTEDDPMSDEDKKKFLERFEDFMTYIGHSY